MTPVHRLDRVWVMQADGGTAPYICQSFEAAMLTAATMLSVPGEAPLQWTATIMVDWEGERPDLDDVRVKIVPVHRGGTATLRVCTVDAFTHL